MKKVYGVSPSDYEWLQYNALVEISNKLSILIKNTVKTEPKKDEITQKCDECKSDMVWAILSNKWVCLDCGNIMTIDDILTIRGTSK